MGFSTFVTEYNRLQAIAGVPTTSNAARYKEMVNDALEMIVAEHDWAFLKSTYTGAFNTEAKYTTGTVTVSKGSTSITGNSAPWEADGLSSGTYEIYLGDEVYGITIGSDSGGNGAGTLSRAATAAFTAATYTIFRRVYSLSSLMRSIESAWVMSRPEWPLKVVEGAEWGLLQSATPVFDYPETLFFTNIDSNDVSQVALDYIPSTVASVYYTGFQEVSALSSDATVIPLPKRFKPAFHEACEYFMYKFRDDARSVTSYQAYRALIDRLIQRDDPSQGTSDIAVLDPHFFRRTNRRAAPSRSGNP